MEPDKLEGKRKTQFKKGQSGNPKGRPKGKTMKEFAREFLLNMDDDSKKDWLKSLAPEIVWKMAEGNPHNTSDENHEVNLQTVLVKFLNGDSNSK